MVINRLETLTTEQVAQIFNIRPATARQWRREGRLSAVRLGRRWLFRTIDVERLLRVSTQMHESAGP